MFFFGVYKAASIILLRLIKVYELERCGEDALEKAVLYAVFCSRRDGGGYGGCDKGVEETERLCWVSAKER
jgi:hypothetical protein